MFSDIESIAFEVESVDPNTPANNSMVITPQMTNLSSSSSAKRQKEIFEKQKQHKSMQSATTTTTATTTASTPSQSASGVIAVSETNNYNNKVVTLDKPPLHQSSKTLPLSPTHLSKGNVEKNANTTNAINTNKSTSTTTAANEQKLSEHEYHSHHKHKSKHHRDKLSSKSSDEESIQFAAESMSVSLLPSPQESDGVHVQKNNKKNNDKLNEEVKENTNTQISSIKATTTATTAETVKTKSEEPTTSGILSKSENKSKLAIPVLHPSSSLSASHVASPHTPPLLTAAALSSRLHHHRSIPRAASVMSNASIQFQMEDSQLNVTDLDGSKNNLTKDRISSDNNNNRNVNNENSGKQKEAHKQVSASLSTEMPWHSIMNSDMAGVTNESIAFMLEDEEVESNLMKKNDKNNNKNSIEDASHFNRNKQISNEKQTQQAVNARTKVEHENEEQQHEQLQEGKHKHHHRKRKSETDTEQFTSSGLSTPVSLMQTRRPTTALSNLFTDTDSQELQHSKEKKNKGAHTNKKQEEEEEDKEDKEELLNESNSSVSLFDEDEEIKTRNTAHSRSETQQFHDKNKESSKSKHHRSHEDANTRQTTKSTIDKNNTNKARKHYKKEHRETEEEGEQQEEELSEDDWKKLVEESEAESKHNQLLLSKSKSNDKHKSAKESKETNINARNTKDDNKEVKTRENMIANNNYKRTHLTPNTQTTPVETSSLVYTTSTTPINTMLTSTNAEDSTNNINNINNKHEIGIQESVDERIAQERKAYLREKELQQQQEEITKIESKKKEKNKDDKKKTREMQSSSEKEEEKLEEHQKEDINKKEQLLNDNNRRKKDSKSTRKQNLHKENEQRRSHSAQARLMQSSELPYHHHYNNSKETESSSNTSNSKDEYSEERESTDRLKDVHHRRSHSEGSIFAVLRHLADQENANPLYRHAKSKHIEWNDQGNKYKAIPINTPTTEHSSNNDSVKKQVQSGYGIKEAKGMKKRVHPEDAKATENKSNRPVHERDKTSPRVHFHHGSQVEKWQKILKEHDARKELQEQELETKARILSDKPHEHKHKKYHHHHHNSKHDGSINNTQEEQNNSTSEESVSSYDNYSKSRSNSSNTHSSESNEHEPSPHSIDMVPTPITQRHHSTKHKEQHQQLLTQTSKHNKDDKREIGWPDTISVEKQNVKARNHHDQYQHNKSTKNTNSESLQNNTKPSNRNTAISIKKKSIHADDDGGLVVHGKRPVDIGQELLEAARKERLHWEQFNRMQHDELEKLKMSLADAEEQDKTLLGITQNNNNNKPEVNYSKIKNASNNRKITSGQGTKDTNYAVMQMQRSMSNGQHQKSNAFFITNQHENERHQQEEYNNNKFMNNNISKNTKMKNMVMQRNAWSALHMPVVSYSSSSPSPSPQHIQYYNDEIKTNKPSLPQQQRSENVLAEQSIEHTNSNNNNNDNNDKAHSIDEVQRVSSENAADKNNSEKRSKSGGSDVNHQNNREAKEIETAETATRTNETTTEDKTNTERQSSKMKKIVNGEYDVDVAAQVASLLGILWQPTPQTNEEKYLNHLSLNTHNESTNLFFITGSRLTQEQVKQFYEVVRAQSSNKRTGKSQFVQQDMVHQLCSFYHVDIDNTAKNNNNSINKWSYYSVKPFRCTSAFRDSAKRRNNLSVKSSSMQSRLYNKSNSAIEVNQNEKTNHGHNKNKTDVATFTVRNHKQCISRTQILRDVFELLDIRRSGVIYHADLPMLHMLLEQELNRVDKLLECYHLHHHHQQEESNNMKGNRGKEQVTLTDLNECTRSNVCTSLIESSRHEWKNDIQYHKYNNNNSNNNNYCRDNENNSYIGELASCFAGKPLPLFDVDNKQINKMLAITSSLALPNTALQGHLIMNTPEMALTSISTQDTPLNLFADNRYESERQYKEFIGWQRRALLLSFAVNVVLPVIRANQIATLPFATFSLLVLQTINNKNSSTRKSKKSSSNDKHNSDYNNRESKKEEQQLVEHDAWCEVVQQYFEVLS